MFDYRNSIHTTTNVSPAHLVFGRKLRSRLDILNSMMLPPSSTSLTNMVNSKQCSQIKANCRKNVTLLTGQYVMYKRYLNKSNFFWEKGIIVQCLGKRVYLVRDCVTSAIIKKHKNQVRLLQGIHNDKQFEDIIEPITAPL